MSTTTTIGLAGALKNRVAAAAKRAGTTAHGFMLDAIAEKTELAERRTELDAVAEQRCAGNVETGKTIPWAKMRGHLEDRTAGKSARRPASRISLRTKSPTRQTD